MNKINKLFLLGTILLFAGCRAHPKGYVIPKLHVGEKILILNDSIGNGFEWKIDEISPDNRFGKFTFSDASQAWRDLNKYYEIIPLN